MHVPRCHVNTTLSNTIFSREYQLFACWLKMFFWIRVEKSMLSVHLVLEICGLKVVVSFNFAPSAPHVKRRVKSCEPRAAAATYNLGHSFNMSSLHVCHTAEFHKVIIWYSRCSNSFSHVHCLHRYLSIQSNGNATSIGQNSHWINDFIIWLYL